jgi:CRP/FNR family transcriptional regulator
VADTSIAELDRLGRSVRNAWKHSILADFPAHAANQLLADARLEHLRPSEVFYRGVRRDSAMPLALVVDGLVRILLMEPSGRQVTIRYAPPGSVVGLPWNLLSPSDGRADCPASDTWLAFGGPARDAKAVRATTLLHLRPGRFRAVMQQDPAACWVVSRQLAAQLIRAEQQLTAELFLPVRARVAAHLLRLAEQTDRELIVRARHEAIAAAMGSVREVVSRELKRMEREGLVQRVGGINGYMRIVDAAALREISIGGDAALTESA